MTLISNAVRSLRAAPVVSTVAILSLALGIGATAAVFSLLDALLLRNLPVRDPGQLAFVVIGDDHSSLTNPLWEAVRDRREGVFDNVAAWGTTRFDLARGGESQLTNGLFVTGAFFNTLGVPAALGRTLTTDDDRRGGGPDGPVVVLSHGFWQRHFGGASDVVGKVLTLARVPYTVVGVTGPRFTGPDVGRSFDVAVPLGTEPLVRGADSSLDRRSYWWLSVIGRLPDGVSSDAAGQRLNARHTQIRDATLPTDWRPEELKFYLEDPFTLQPAASGTSTLRRRYDRPLKTMMGLVALVLLIACANIANLLLARASARRREFGVRLALGASRMQLAKQLLTESLLLALCGAAAGLYVARWGSALLVRQLSTQVNTVFLDVSLDWRIIAFTTVVAVVTALLFGVAPAWRAGRVDAGEALVSHSRGTSGDARSRVASTLVIVQVALSLVLVVGAGVFVRTFTLLATRDLGFEREAVLVTNINTQKSGLAPEQRAAHYERLRQAVLTVPGVMSASASVVTPISGSTWQYPVEVPDRPDLPDADAGVHVNLLQPDWFRTYQTAILSGRDFTTTDTPGSTPVALLNETAVTKLFLGANPIGRTIRQPGRPGRPPVTMEIVGIVRDAAYRSVREPVPATLYVPLAQQPEPPPAVSLSVRAAQGPPLALSKAIEGAVRQVDSSASLTFRALDDQVNAALVQERLLAMLSGFFGVLALLLAGLGLYGVTTYAVSLRRVEMGIRMALGSTPGGVIALVLSRVAWMVGAGVVVGSLGSYWAAGLVSSLAWGVQARDAATFVLAAAVLAGVGAAAGWLPARRASRIDPARVLREG